MTTCPSATKRAEEFVDLLLRHLQLPTRDRVPLSSAR